MSELVAVHSKPANATEFDENLDVAEADLMESLSGMTPEELAGANIVFAFHKKWTPTCGHKRLGRLYNRS
jgi:hypothetical protein